MGRADSAQSSVQDRLPARGTGSAGSVLGAEVAKEDLAEEEGLELDSENSRNQAQPKP